LRLLKEIFDRRSKHRIAMLTDRATFCKVMTAAVACEDALREWWGLREPTWLHISRTPRSPYLPEVQAMTDITGADDAALANPNAAENVLLAPPPSSHTASRLRNHPATRYDRGPAVPPPPIHSTDSATSSTALFAALNYRSTNPTSSPAPIHRTSLFMAAQPHS
jgi:hypothetical protein